MGDAERYRKQRDRAEEELKEARRLSEGIRSENRIMRANIENFRQSNRILLGTNKGLHED